MASLYQGNWGKNHGSTKDCGMKFETRIPRLNSSHWSFEAWPWCWEKAPHRTIRDQTTLTLQSIGQLGSSIVQVFVYSDALLLLWVHLKGFSEQQPSTNFPRQDFAKNTSRRDAKGMLRCSAAMREELAGSSIELEPLPCSRLLKRQPLWLPNIFPLFAAKWVNLGRKMRLGRKL